VIFKQIFGYFEEVLKRNFTPYIYVFILLWNLCSVYGQKLTLKITAKDSLNTIRIHSIQYQKEHNTEISIFASVDTIKTKLIQKGFFNTRVDTILKKDSIYHAQFYLGKPNQLIRVYYTDTTLSKKQLFSITSSATDSYFDTKIKKVPTILNAIVAIFENQGNSFTEVSLKNIAFKKERIEAYLHIKKTNTRKINKIIINGYTHFPKKFLSHHLQLKNNTLFTKSKLDKTSALLNTLPFVSETKPPETLFTKDSTIVYLSLQKKAANTFDGLIGFASKEGRKGLSFNGYLDITLHNIFNSGESFSLYWKNNGDKRQVLDLSLKLPYVYNSKLSPQIALNIYKQDSTFITTKAMLALPYAINMRSAIGASVQSETSSNLLTLNNNTNIDSYNTIFYGINYRYHTYNQHPLFPIKFNVQSEILRGRRKMNNNTLTQSKIRFNTSYIWSFDTKNHVYIHNETGFLFSKNTLSNELFRIGGVNSIRGFNEESITAPSYSFLNAEYRFAPNNASYLYTVTDMGYIYSKNNNQKSTLLGLGLGYAFKTKFGLLNLSYVAGKFSERPFDFNNSKVHIKVLSFF